MWLQSPHGTDRTVDVIHIGLTVTERGWLTARLYLDYDCLQLLLMQAAQNTE